MRWNRRRVIQGFVAVVVAVVPFMVTMPSAFAGLGFGVTPTFPPNVTVGQTGLSASIQIINFATAPEDTSSVNITAINLVPACGVSFPGNATGDCPAADADPGVFQLSATGTGEAGTACAGTTFTIAVIDPSTGQVSFTPSTPVVLGPANGSGASPVCRIDFTFNVLKAPTKSAGSPGPGEVQTDQIGYAAGVAVSDGVSGNGNGSSVVTVMLAAPSISTMASAGGPVGTSISDSATLSPASPPGPSPTGTITFNLYGPGTVCTTTPVYTKAVTVTGTGTYSSGGFSPTAPGTYEWVASYSGDANDLATASACGAEPVTVSLAAPTITTTPSPATTIGGTISDSATLSGGFNPMGAITFSVYGPGNATCTGATAFAVVTVPVSGNGTYSSGIFTPTAPGNYNYIAAYSGDPDNAAVASACASESTTVNKGTPAIVTTASGPVLVGGTISDHAVLSGGVDIPTGSITFSVYGPNNATCTGMAAFTSNTEVSGNGSYSSADFTPTAAGTYLFVASYSGDTNNIAVVSPCGAAGESVVVTAPVPAAGTYTPVTPARDLDTRNGTGGVTGPIAGNTTFAVKVTGVNGVPATGVGAVVLNVAVTAPTCAAWLTVFPTGQAVPASSNLNYTVGETIPNLVVVGVGTGGDVSFNVPSACAGKIQVIADVQGWYATQSATPAPGTYTPLAPARDLDTRNGTGGAAGPVAGNTTFNLTVTGLNGVPTTGVGAVALNVTVTDPTCAAWLTVFPTLEPVPSSSNLNYTVGETIANLVVVGVSTGGQVSFNVPSACAGKIQVIADVQGWYATQSATPAPGTYTPLAPGRDLDTRNGTGGVHGPVAGNTNFTLTVTGVNGVPTTGVGAVALNVTVTNPTCAAYLTVFPTGQPVPATSNLNYTAGETIANLVIVGVGTDGDVSFNVPSACTGSIQVIADIQGWYGPTV